MRAESGSHGPQKVTGEVVEVPNGDILVLLGYWVRELIASLK